MAGGSRGTGRRRDPASDAEFQRRVDEARQMHNISDIVARTRKVTKAGNREKVALCAFHNERSPSMQLNDAKGTYHCFGCKASGDIIRYVMETEGLGFVDALDWLGASDLPIVSPEQRAQRAAEDAAERAQAIAEARMFWERGVPAAGTPAEVYARSRGIVMPLPSSIRFGMVPAWRDKETGEWARDLPALIGAVTIDGELVAIQRIFLRNGGRAKANMTKPKLSLGRVLGGALWLGPPAEEIIITEGPEDALSLAQEIEGRTVLAALGTAMMPEIKYPPIVRRITIAGQNDAAGRLAVDKAALALTERGFDVRLMFPHADYKDWNDQLRGVRK